MGDATLRKRERDAKKNAQTEGRSRKPGNLRSQTKISRETFNPVSVLSRKILCISLVSLYEGSLLRRNGIRLIHSLNVLELIRIKKTRSAGNEASEMRCISTWLPFNTLFKHSRDIMMINKMPYNVLLIRYRITTMAQNTYVKAYTTILYSEPRRTGIFKLYRENFNLFRKIN